MEKATSGKKHDCLSMDTEFTDDGDVKISVSQWTEKTLEDCLMKFKDFKERTCPAGCVQRRFDKEARKMEWELFHHFVVRILHICKRP